MILKAACEVGELSKKCRKQGTVANFSLWSGFNLALLAFFMYVKACLRFFNGHKWQHSHLLIY